MNNFYLAVLDIGKTNKKVLIYDQNLKMVVSTYKTFEQIDHGDFLSDDLEAIYEWFLSSLKNFAQQYAIQAISISAHGATFVAVDEKGNLTIPEICYTTEPGEDFHEEFYQEFGQAEALQKATATPNFMALLNVSKGIFYAKKHFPEAFNATRYFLNLPQYFSFRLTGVASAEPTYVGCHSYLWNFEKNTWSDVAHQLGIMDKLPDKIVKSWEVIGSILPEVASTTGLSSNVKVNPGLHDSNASLLPYLIKMKEPFILNSTGTWCVVMKEAEQVQFSPDELGKVVFYNLNVFNKPVKTAIFLAGLEFETYTDILKNLNKDHDFPEYDHELYQQIIENGNEFILPGVTKGTGQFPDSEARVISGNEIYSLEEIQAGTRYPEFFKNYEYAYAVLILSLAIQTKVALDRTGIQAGMPIFTEGGFRKNDCYNKLLTAFYPQSAVFTTALAEATAFGAAITALAGLTDNNPRNLQHLISIETRQMDAVKFTKLENYTKKFMSYI